MDAITDGKITCKLSSQQAQVRVPVPSKDVTVRLRNMHVVTLFAGDHKFEFVADPETARRIAYMMSHVPDDVLGKARHGLVWRVLPGLGEPFNNGIGFSK